MNEPSMGIKSSGPSSKPFTINSSHELLECAILLKNITESCDVVKLPGGCTLETVPKIYMDAARQLLKIPEPEPTDLNLVFRDPEQG